MIKLKKLFLFCFVFILFSGCPHQTLPAPDHHALVQTGLQQNLISSCAGAVRADITQYIELNGERYRKHSYSQNIDKNKVINLEFSNFGEWTCVIDYYDNENKKLKTETITRPVTAKSYNIGFLCATLPALNYVLSLGDISTPDAPSIFALERTLVDYTALPENSFPFPLASTEELNTQHTPFYNGYGKRVGDYIAMLYRLDPESKFNLYLCDHQCRYVLPFFYSNNIPEKNFYVYLLSDGAGSYKGFNTVFKASADDTYAKMAESWKLAKQKAKEIGPQSDKFNTGADSYSAGEIKFVKSFEWQFAYAYVMAKENTNIEWNLNRAQLLKYNGIQLCDKDTLSDGDNVIITSFNLGNKLKRIREKGKDAELKRLVKYNDDALAPVLSANKKAFILLGTYPEDDLEQFIKATKKYFGDEYTYFYKGHPAYPLYVGDDKFTLLNDTLQVKILDSTIPAEIFMFFNPEIYIGGYGSSTYFSNSFLTGGDDQFLTLWRYDTRIYGTDKTVTAKIAMNIENDGRIKIIAEDGEKYYNPTTDAIE